MAWNILSRFHDLVLSEQNEGNHHGGDQSSSGGQKGRDPWQWQRRVVPHGPLNVDPTKKRAATKEKSHDEE